MKSSVVQIVLTRILAALVAVGGLAWAVFGDASPHIVGGLMIAFFGVGGLLADEHLLT